MWYENQIDTLLAKFQRPDFWLSEVKYRDFTTSSSSLSHTWRENEGEISGQGTNFVTWLMEGKLG